MMEIERNAGNIKEQEMKTETKSARKKNKK